MLIDLSSRHAAFMSTPYPYILLEQALEPSLYDELSTHFPAPPANLLASKKGRKSIVRGSAAYDEVLRSSPGWQQLHDFVHSQAIVDAGMRVYGDYLRAHPGCLIDPDRLFYKDFVEDHSLVAPAALYERRQHVMANRSPLPFDRHELFSRMDFFHGLPNRYEVDCHNDWPHRLFSVILYFVDLNEATGGAFRVMDSSRKTVAEFYPRSNTGVSHLSALPEALHGVERFRGPGLRRMIQIQVSSHFSVCRDH